MAGQFTLKKTLPGHSRSAAETAEGKWQEPLMLRLMKILGIGLINTFALLATIGDIHRFARPEQLVAYLGLSPGQRQSGQGKDIRLGVRKRGRGDLRHLLIQGAHAVLLGKKLRAELALPGTLDDCLAHFLQKLQPLTADGLMPREKSPGA